MRNESKMRRTRRLRREWVAAGLCSDCGKVRTGETKLCFGCANRRVSNQQDNRRKAQASIEEMRRQLAPFMEKGEA